MLSPSWPRTRTGAPSAGPCSSTAVAKKRLGKSVNGSAPQVKVAPAGQAAPEASAETVKETAPQVKVAPAAQIVERLPAQPQLFFGVVARCIDPRHVLDDIMATALNRAAAGDGRAVIPIRTGDQGNFRRAAVTRIC